MYNTTQDKLNQFTKILKNTQTKKWINQKLTSLEHENNNVEPITLNNQNKFTIF